MYGPEPLGYFILTAEGRLMVIETVRDRQPPQNDVDNAALFKSMLAYSGHCRVLDDNRFVTDVDVAWHPAWMNTEQTRAFEIDDDLPFGFDCRHDPSELSRPRGPSGRAVAANVEVEVWANRGVRSMFALPPKADIVERGRHAR